MAKSAKDVVNRNSSTAAQIQPSAPPLVVLTRPEVITRTFPREWWLALSFRWVGVWSPAQPRRPSEESVLGALTAGVSLTAAWETVRQCIVTRHAKICACLGSSGSVILKVSICFQSLVIYNRTYIFYVLLHVGCIQFYILYFIKLVTRYCSSVLSKPLCPCFYF